MLGHEISGRDMPVDLSWAAAFPARIMLGLAIMFLFAAGIVAQEEAGLKDRFLKEAPSAWRDYESFAKRLQGRVVTKSTIRGKTREVQGEIKQNANCQMYVYQPVATGGEMIGELTAFNRQYGFSLSRRSQESPWTVSGIVMNSPGQKSRPYSDTQDRARRVLDLVILERTKLIDLFEKPTIRILGVKPITRDGRNCVEIRFDNTHPVSEEPFVPEQRGTIILDPSRSWCLCSAELQCGYLGDNGTEEIQVNITTAMRDGKSGHPIPVQRLFKNPNAQILFEHQLEEPERLPPDDAFTLSAFGLPEPLGVTKPRPWYLWLSLAGMLCLIGGGILYWLKRRAAGRAE